MNPSILTLAAMAGAFVMTSADVKAAELKVLAGVERRAGGRLLDQVGRAGKGNVEPVAGRLLEARRELLEARGHRAAGQHLQLGRLHVSGRHDERARHRGERQDGWIHGGPSWGRVYHLSAPLHHWDGS